MRVRIECGFLICAAILLTPLATADTLPPPAARAVDFAADIQPILAARCLECHGSKKQKGELRLDGREAAMRGGLSGAVIVPGASADSLLVKNIGRVGDATPMPPKGEPLTPEQIGLIRAWIDQGAKWPDAGAKPDAGKPNPAAPAMKSGASGAAPGGEGSPHPNLAHADHADRDPRADHWSFKPPVRVDPPAVARAEWPRNPIDHFILARLEKEGLAPSPEADPATLVRRLNLDLIGLPPSPEEVDAYAADPSPAAYDAMVDRLLASPRFGERWGRKWLDLARYADTNGYEKDRDRSVWPYRDWVINAINANMPFNQFAVEQLAGDMLPGATLEQRIATGFQRNTMLNEEGGIDVAEDRFKSMVDRMEVVGAAFLGLTIQCAQCHDHKYDPISQREYYQLFAFMDSADEPFLEIPTLETTEALKKAEAKIAKLDSELELKFPPFSERVEWTPLKPVDAKSEAGAALKVLEDGSVLAGAADGAALPDKDVYEVQLAGAPGDFDLIRIEALTDDSLPAKGPGRTREGNFVITEVAAWFGPAWLPEAAKPLEFSAAEVDFAQENYPAAGLIDGDPKTGWAIAVKSGAMNVNRAATLTLKTLVAAPAAEGPKNPGERRMRVRLAQEFGGGHTVGRFRVSAGRRVREHYRPDLAEAEQRRRHLEDRLAEWKADAAARSTRWTTLDPAAISSEYGATLTKLDDLSVLATGDKPNRDTYVVEADAGPGALRGLRIEAMLHPTLPNNGPGRGDLLGVGNFMLSEIKIEARAADAPPEAAWIPVELQNPTADYAAPGKTPDKTLDGATDTGWAIDGGEGHERRFAIEFKNAPTFPAGARLRVTLLQRYIHQTTFGRFRLSVAKNATPDAALAGAPASAPGSTPGAALAIAPIRANEFPADIEAALLAPEAARSPESEAAIRKFFLSAAPELAAQNKELDALRSALPRPPTTLVMRERGEPRVTKIHPRGEFLRDGPAVSPAAPAVLPPPPEGAPPNRLTFARWLVDPRNPLVARVAMNRQWMEIFGHGLVATPDDFGLRCEPPTHPELLDWLATEFVARGWDAKAMLRLVATSATYRQSSVVAPAARERDPANTLLARAPRFRIDAELVRDAALSACGLLSAKMGGPSVKPPQPPGVTELAYGSPSYAPSTGEDRYRRGVYTYLKRTAPYPSFITFDAPTADRACPRRNKSNTPLQSLTLLNDEVYMEAARALAKRAIADEGANTAGNAEPIAAANTAATTSANTAANAADKTSTARIERAFRLCLARRPTDEEMKRLTAFHAENIAKFARGEGAPAKIAGAEEAAPPAPGAPSVNDLAALTLVSRALLNLDETITRE